MSASLLTRAGVSIPPNTAILETVRSVDQHHWQFPIIVQPSQEHAGIGLDRASIVHSKNALRLRVREILRTYNQPALAQRFLPGREFNVGIIGGNRLRVLPLAEVDYSALPTDIPPIMSYAAKWVETFHRIPKDFDHLPGRSGAGVSAPHQRSCVTCLPRSRRPRLWPGGHAPG